MYCAFRPTASPGDSYGLERLHRVGGNRIGHRQVRGAQHAMRAPCPTPSVPLRSFPSIEHVVVADRVDPHEPQTARGPVAEGGRLAASVTAPPPPLAAGKKAFPWHVRGIEIDRKALRQDLVDLRIGAMPR